MSAVVVVQPQVSNLVIFYQSLGTADLLSFKMTEEYQRAFVRACYSPLVVLCVAGEEILAAIERMSF